MTTALATTTPTTGGALAQLDSITREQVDLLKRTICYGASDAEFQFFVGFCRRLQLDPFSKQVHFVPRRVKDPRTNAWVEKRDPMVSIDGFRVIAERSGRYEGQTAPQWCGEDGVWKDVWLSEKPPAAARVGIYKAGFREPIYQPAAYLSYVQLTRDEGPTATWKKMPDVMLSKCAEALALRKAFPNDLCGVYSPEEMSQASRGDDADFVEASVQERTAPGPAAIAEGAAALSFEILRDRLNAVPGYVGDEHKEDRKKWIADALGYKSPPAHLFNAYAKADPASKRHVQELLEELERAAADDVPAFETAVAPPVERAPGEDDGE